GRKISGIREEDRRPDDRTEAEVELLENRLDVPQALARLPSDVRGSPFARLRPGPQRRLSGDEDEAVGDDAMGIRPHGLRMVRQFRDSLHDPSARECRGAQKGCDPRRASEGSGSAEAALPGPPGLSPSSKEE